MAPLIKDGQKYLTMRERPWKQATLDKVGAACGGDVWLLYRPSPAAGAASASASAPPPSQLLVRVVLVAVLARPCIILTHNHLALTFSHPPPPSRLPTHPLCRRWRCCCP